MNLVPFTSKSNPALHVESLTIAGAMAVSTTSAQVAYTSNRPDLAGLTFLIFPQTDTVPEMRFLTDGLDCFIFVAGTKTPAQALNIFGSWARSVQVSYDPPWSGFIANCALNVYLNIVSSSVSSGCRRFRLIGHSWGGAVATAFLANYMPGPTDPQREVLTYGGYRVATNYQRQLASYPYYVRCFGADDIVANLPPHTNEAPGWMLFYPADQVTGMNSQVQPCNGIAIDAAGNLAASYQIPTAWSSRSQGFVAWMLGTQAEGSQPHALATYAVRWLIAAASAPEFNVPIPTSPQSEIVRIPVSVQRQQQRSAVAQAAAVAESNPGAQIAATAPMVTLAPTVKFTRRTINHIRYVAYGDELVAVCENERQQKRFVRLYNAWLRNNGQIG